MGCGQSKTPVVVKEKKEVKASSPVPSPPTQPDTATEKEEKGENQNPTSAPASAMKKPSVIAVAHKAEEKEIKGEEKPIIPEEEKTEEEKKKDEERREKKRKTREKRRATGDKKKSITDIPKKKQFDSKRTTSNNGGAGMLNALALQFPNILRSFKAVFDAFDEMHTGGQGIKQEITLDRLATVMNHVVKVENHFDSESCKDLFHVADLDASKTLAFREFLISVAMGYYLKEVQADDKPHADENFRIIQKGFKVVEKAFHDMDADKGGSIDEAELKAALFAATNSDDESVLEARFRELDFNGDGDILLPEFLYGMVSWVGFYDEEEEKEEERKMKEEEEKIVEE